MITLPELFNSELIIFRGEHYFSTFFDRKGPEQTWIPLPPRRSLKREWDLDTAMPEMGYEEHIVCEEYECHGEIWFFGDVQG